MENQIQTITFNMLPMTIGVLPSSYVDSMSYYETLLWLCNYLENTVIPTVNNNGQAVEELQSAYLTLHDYVEHYFDNLDVQNEINNKLDQMATDGSLTNLIKAYVDPIYQGYEATINATVNQQNTEISDFKTSINSQIGVINNKVDNATSGSPLVASSTIDMTDTTRIYVNTTDGNWYYYDGDSWEIGGVYQSSGISNGSIDILMLDNDLQKNYFIDYSQTINLGTPIAGFMKNNGDIVTDTNYNHYAYSLENGKSYIFGGNNLSQLAALVIKDSSNNVVYGSNPTNTSGRINYAFKVKASGLTAYISYQNNLTEDRFVRTIAVVLRELNNIYNQLRYTTNIPIALHKDDTFTQAGIIGSDNILKYQSSEGFDLDFYQASKGRTYNIHGYNRYNVATCVITDINGGVLWASSDSNIGSTWEEFTKSYVCEQDGFIAITKFSDASHEEATITVVNEGIDITQYNPLVGKKLGCDGDSIMKGSGNDNTSYADYIATNNSMELQQLAIGGGTIAYGTMNGDNPRHWICTSVANLDSDCDVVLINGGFNDKGVNVPLGEYIDSYTASVDNTTFYGGLETLCRNLLNKFTTNTKIYFVTNHHANNWEYASNSIGLTGYDYLEATRKVMKKYGIEMIEIGENTHLNTDISIFKTNYTSDGDGVHPNEYGYKYFYVPYIESKIKKD